jgi:hypothetical protein
MDIPAIEDMWRCATCLDIVEDFVLPDALELISCSCTDYGTPRSSHMAQENGSS